MPARRRVRRFKYGTRGTYYEIRFTDKSKRRRWLEIRSNKSIDKLMEKIFKSIKKEKGFKRIKLLKEQKVKMSYFDYAMKEVKTK